MTTQTKTNFETTLLEILSQLPKPLQLKVLHFAQFLVSRHHQNGFSPESFETSIMITQVMKHVKGGKASTLPKLCLEIVTQSELILKAIAP